MIVVPWFFDVATFEADGVVTRAEELHGASWKELFDDVLRRTAASGARFEPFDNRLDYRAYARHCESSRNRSRTRVDTNKENGHAKRTFAD